MLNREPAPAAALVAVAVLGDDAPACLSAQAHRAARAIRSLHAAARVVAWLGADRFAALPDEWIAAVRDP